MSALPTYPVSVKGVLRAPTGEVVLLLNEREEWELPGGRIELGESSTECLAREIAEELDLRAEVGAPIDTYLFEVVPGKHVFIATYACALVGAFAPRVSHEHKRLGLFAPDALPDNLPAGYRASIAAVLKALALHDARALHLQPQSAAQPDRRNRVCSVAECGDGFRRLGT